MTLDQCFAKYQGTSVDVDGVQADTGQCVQWADVVLMEVYGQHIHYGNAIDWWNDPGDLLTDGFEKITDGSVKKGDFVIFNTRVGSQYGHIDVALTDGTTDSFLGADSNWNGNLTVHQVQHKGAQYVLGSLRLKGEDMPTLLSQKQILADFQAYGVPGNGPGGSVTQEQLDYYSSRDQAVFYVDLIEALHNQLKAKQAEEDKYIAGVKQLQGILADESNAASKIDQIKKILS